MAKTTTQEQVEKFKEKATSRKLKEGGTEFRDPNAPEPKQEAGNGAEQPERIIPDKTFPVLPCKQGNIETVLIAMTMADCVDYLTYAEDLYDVVKDEKGEAIETDPTMKWQRSLNTDRAAKQIAPYLQNEVHFFPSLVAVINGEVQLDDMGLTCAAHSLGTLDGQHRLCGISKLLAEVGPDSEFAAEQISVIVITSNLDIAMRQQIFADVNRQAKVVSKAINILFDHRDEYAQLAHSIAKELGNVVDLERTVPTPTSTNACSLSNIYNLAVNVSSYSKKGQKPTRWEGMTDSIIKNVTLSMIRNLPDFDGLLAGHIKYKTVRQYYTCYSSTLFQSLGSAMWHQLNGLPPESWAETAGKLVAGTNWSFTGNPVWAVKGVASQNEKGIWSVGTRSEHVTAATATVTGLWGKLHAELRGEGSKVEGAEGATEGATA